MTDIYVLRLKEQQREGGGVKRHRLNLSMPIRPLGNGPYSSNSSRIAQPLQQIDRHRFVQTQQRQIARPLPFAWRHRKHRCKLAACRACPKLLCHFHEGVVEHISCDQSRARMH